MIFFPPNINYSTFLTDTGLLQSDWLELANQLSVPSQTVLFTSLSRLVIRPKCLQIQNDIQINFK